MSRRHRAQIEQDRGLESDNSQSINRKIDWIAATPAIVKSLVVKFWFGGAIFFFMGFGLFFEGVDALDLTLAIGLVLGLFTDIIINRLLVGIDDDKGSTRKYLMFYNPKLWFLLFNLLYCVVLAFLISFTYTAINIAFIEVYSLEADAITLGAEPITYGLFFVMYDLVAVSIRNLIRSLIRKLRGASTDEV